MSINYRKAYQFVWGEWFRLLDEVIADPRCQVDRDTVIKRLEIYPIQEAVKLEPSWKLEDIQPIGRKDGRKGDLRKIKRCRTSIPLRLRMLKQGVPIELIHDPWPVIYKQVAPENTTIAYKTWYHYRVQRGWNIYTAFQDFWHIFFGKKYASYSELRREFPWLSKHGITTDKFNKTHYVSYEWLERTIAC